MRRKQKDIPKGPHSLSSSRGDLLWGRAAISFSSEEDLVVFEVSGTKDSLCFGNGVFSKNVALFKKGEERKKTQLVSLGKKKKHRVASLHWGAP